MAPKTHYKGKRKVTGKSSRPQKRKQPEIYVNASVASRQNVEIPRSRRTRNEEEETRGQSDAMRREVEMLRREVKELRRERQNKSKGDHVSRQEARRVLDEGGVSMFRFLKLGLPEFRGEDGDEPSEFLEQIDKVIKRLPCSDARAIELVGLLLKDYAWDWFSQSVEDSLYSDSPPTWESFKDSMLEEFLADGEKAKRIAQFEQLKQRDMSVCEYAKEFKKLVKYAKIVVPTEKARVDRFCRGLNATLHNSLCAIEFPTLNKLIDRAKQMEVKLEEERAEMELKRKDKGKVVSENEEQERSTTKEVLSEDSTCSKCGQKHEGECATSSKVYWKCGEMGHIRRECPEWNDNEVLENVNTPLEEVQDEEEWYEDDQSTRNDSE